MVAGQPLVTHTWSSGRLVFAARYPVGAVGPDRASVIQMPAPGQEGRAVA
jgi:alpha-D-ribose 1-methylphosphonate 5-triphosphate diphosphatase